MAAPGYFCASEPDPNQAQKQGAQQASAANGEIVVNLPENADAIEQRHILDALPVLVFLERDGKIIFANREARQMLGLNEGEWTPRPVEEVLWGLLPGTAEPQTLLSGTRSGSPFHATMPAGSGRLMPVEGTYSQVSSQSRDAASHDAVIVAHPAEHERAPKSRLMEDVLASLPEAVAIVHSNHVLYTNQAFTAMFGYAADEAGGESLRKLIVPEARINEDARLLQTVDEKGRVSVETVRTSKSGESVQVSLQITPLRVDGAGVGYVFSFRESGEHKVAEARLQHDAMHDALTGLPNRALFMDRLAQALNRRARRPEQGCGIIHLTLDRFKEITDALGHAAGDDLLKSIALRLSATLRPEDTAARFGGDHFALLVENIATAADLEIVAARVLGEIERPIQVYGHTLQSGASLGAAMAGAGTISADQLVRDAESALLRARQSGGSRYEIFDKRLKPVPPTTKTANKTSAP
jgi:diguanylate cyclase (GGDEF)-like protein/PAS domain S-box-containing protein